MRKWGFFFLITAVSLVRATTLNEFPALAMNGGGNAVALWQGYDTIEHSTVIRTASLPFGESWSSPETLSPGGKTAMYPKVAIDLMGQMIGVWEAAIGTTFSIQAAIGQFDGSWGPALTLSENAYDNTCPDIDIDASGNGLLLWQMRFNGAFVIETSDYTSGSDTWSSPAMLTVSSRTLLFPKAVVNATGKSFAFWQQLSSLANVIQASTSNLGMEWSAPVTLSNPSYNSTSVQGAINDSGLAIALWQQGTETGITIGAAICSPEGVWGEAATLSTDGTFSTNPIVAMNASDKIVVIWQNSSLTDTTVQTIQTVTYSDGAWSAPITLSNPSLRGTNPFLAINSAGQAIAVWAGNGVIQAATLSSGNVWSSVSQLSDPAYNSSHPQCGIDASGNGVAVWQTTVGSDKEIQASVYTSGGPWAAKTVISD